MPVVYTILAKMIVNRIKEPLIVGIHSAQYGLIPHRQILDNVANVLIGMEYAKYTQQDVLVMQVDIEKAFDTVEWDFIADTMRALGFGPDLADAVYFFYANSTSSGLLDRELTNFWTLGCSVRQGCPLNALIYATVTHPLLLHLDHLLSLGRLHGLTLPLGNDFVGQAYADDSLFMPRNTQEDLQEIMQALDLFGLAAGLHVNFRIKTPVSY
ncbi:hypothetical protein L7F22_002017 [Adiantum nelumboides]|nr:hypothetical protein [Adiantum nelumboides]